MRVCRNGSRGRLKICWAEMSVLVRVQSSAQKQLLYSKKQRGVRLFNSMEQILILWKDIFVHMNSVFKIIDMSPSSKFWLGVLTLSTIGLIVVLHPIMAMVFLCKTLFITITLFLFLIILGLLLPDHVLEDIFEFWDRVFEEPIKLFNSWLNSKFGK